MADCTISGTIKNVQGAPVANVKVFALKTMLSGTVIQYKQRTLDTSDENGLVSFVLPRGANVWLHVSPWAKSGESMPFAPT